MKKLFTLLALVMAGSALADGSASLFLRNDFDNNQNFVEVNEHDGKITGRSTFGANGIVNLKNEDGAWKGWAHGQNWKLACDAGHCQSQGGSYSTDVTVTQGHYDGVMNLKHVEATIQGDTIEISVPMGGTLQLTKTREGRYEARGQLATGQLVSGDLKVDGSFANEQDPALFIILLIAPFVGA